MQTGLFEFSRREHEILTFGKLSFKCFDVKNYK